MPDFWPDGDPNYRCAEGCSQPNCPAVCVADQVGYGLDDSLHRLTENLAAGGEFNA